MKKTIKIPEYSISALFLLFLGFNAYYPHWILNGFIIIIDCLIFVYVILMFLLALNKKSIKASLTAKENKKIKKIKLGFLGYVLDALVLLTAAYYNYQFEFWLYLFAVLITSYNMTWFKKLIKSTEDNKTLDKKESV